MPDVAAAAAPSVAGPPSDPTAVREAIRREGLAVPDGRAAAGRALGGLAVYAAVAAAALAVDAGPVWPFAWAAMAVCLLGAAGATHEALHGSLARGSRVNAASGTLASLLVLLPFDSYRQYHLAHHAATATEDDPEGDYRLPSRLVHLLLPVGGLAFWAELWWYGLATWAGRPPRWVRTRAQRAALRRSTALTLAVAVLAGAAAVAEPLVWRLWLVPAAVAAWVLLPFLLLPDHYGAYGQGGRGALETTRTTVSGPLLRRAFWSTNLHAAHHFAPRVPAHHLARVDELIRPLQDPSWRSASFVGWHVQLFRSLPWRAHRSHPEAVSS